MSVPAEPFKPSDFYALERITKGIYACSSMLYDKEEIYLLDCVVVFYFALIETFDQHKIDGIGQPGKMEETLLKGGKKNITSLGRFTQDVSVNIERTLDFLGVCEVFTVKINKGKKSQILIYNHSDFSALGPDKLKDMMMRDVSDCLEALGVKI